jgi:predicted RNA methylase
MRVLGPYIPKEETDESEGVLRPYIPKDAKPSKPAQKLATKPVASTPEKRTVDPISLVPFPPAADRKEDRDKAKKARADRMKKPLEGGLRDLPEAVERAVLRGAATVESSVALIRGDTKGAADAIKRRESIKSTKAYEEFNNPKVPKGKRVKEDPEERAKAVGLANFGAPGFVPVQSKNTSRDTEQLKASLRALKSDPVNVIAELTTESLVMMAPTMPLAAGAGIAGGLAGGPAGALVGAGAVVGGTSGGIEATQSIIDAYRQEGVDVSDPKQLASALSDRKKYERIRNKAIKKGVVVGLFDAVSVGLGGRIWGGAGKGLVKKVVAGSAETLAQGGLGGGGEYFGALAAGERPNPSAVLAEVAGEGGPGTVQIAYGAAVYKGKQAQSIRKRLNSAKPGQGVKTPAGALTITEKQSPEQVKATDKAGAVHIVTAKPNGEVVVKPVEKPETKAKPETANRATLQARIQISKIQDVIDSNNAKLQKYAGDEAVLDNPEHPIHQILADNTRLYDEIDVLQQELGELATQRESEATDEYVRAEESKRLQGLMEYSIPGNVEPRYRVGKFKDGKWAVTGKTGHSFTYVDAAASEMGMTEPELRALIAEHLPTSADRGLVDTVSGTGRFLGDVSDIITSFELKRLQAALRSKYNAGKRAAGIGPSWQTPMAVEAPVIEAEAVAPEVTTPPIVEAEPSVTPEAANVPPKPIVKSDINKAIDAVLKIVSDTPLYVYQTSQGYESSAGLPDDSQKHVVVYPDKAVQVDGNNVTDLSQAAEAVSSPEQVPVEQDIMQADVTESPEDTLRAAGLVVTEATTKAGKTYWQVSGNTYEHKALLDQAGAAKPFKMGGKWIRSFFDGDPTGNIAAALRSGQPAVTDGTVEDTAAESTEPGRTGDEDLERERKRAEQDGLADRGGVDRSDPSLVQDSTVRLLLEGERYHIPRDVIEDQIEDVALISRAFTDDGSVFVLANEAGTGKTFVLGGAIRELKRLGAGKIIYVTLNQRLISQIKGDLLAYGVEDVEFVTYSQIRSGGAAAPGSVVIFDESQSIKDTTSAQGKAAQSMIGQAHFTILSSATPFENPVQAQYMDATGVFDKVGGWHEWAKMYGATVIKKKSYNYETDKKEIVEILRWVGGRHKKADQQAAREWFRKQGIFTQRKKRLPAGMVESRFRKFSVASEYAEMVDRLEMIYQRAADLADQDNGDPVTKAQIAMHSVNLVKRVLEAAKAPEAIKLARQLIEEGKQAVMFVETKADRSIGRFRQTGESSGTLYTYPQMRKLMDQYEASLEKWFKSSRKATRPKAPFANAIILIAQAMHENGFTFELPSVLDMVESEFKDEAAYYTGAQTDAKANKDLDAWKRGEKGLLVATMAKGGTGLSLHDTTGKMPLRVQIGLNLPWTATQVEQVAGRLARYGTSNPVGIEWVFADNITFERRLASRVGSRMSDMGALVKGITVGEAEALQDFDFEDGFDPRTLTEEATEGGFTAEDDTAELYRQAEALEKSRGRAENTEGDLFETPYPLAVFMSRIAGIESGDVVLEPSAGRGNLIRFIPENAGVIVAVEQRSDNVGALNNMAAKNAKMSVVQSDFLAYDPMDTVDVVLMNPPFSRLKGVGWQDIAHIEKAYSHLADGGRLVAILSEGPFFRQDSQSDAFRQWLEDVGATAIKLPDGAFKQSGTMVNTRMIVIDKAAAGTSGRTDVDLADMDTASLIDLEVEIQPRESAAREAQDIAAIGGGDVAGTINAAVPEAAPPQPGATVFHTRASTVGRGDAGYFHFENEEVEEAFRAASNPETKETLAKRIKGGYQTFKERATRTYEHLPRGEEYARVHYALVSLGDKKNVASRKAGEYLEYITLELNPALFDLFTQSVVFTDLAEMVAREEYGPDDPLPFNLTKDTLETELSRIHRQVSASPAVTEALKRRRSIIQGQLKEDYISSMEDIGFNVRERLNRTGYFRHQVLSHIQESGGRLKGTGGRLKTPAGRGFLKGRTGSAADFSTNYLQAEWEVLTQMIYDIEVARVIKTVQDNHDALDQCKAAAKRSNYINTQPYFEKMAVEMNKERNADLAPLTWEDAYRRILNWKQAMGWSKLRDIFEAGYMPEGMPQRLLQAFDRDAEDSDSGASFALISWLAANDPESDAGMAARLIFKGMADKKKMLLAILGENFKTWEDMVPDGFVTWQPREGNIFFHSMSLPEKLVESLQAGIAESLGINLDQLQDVVVMGGKRRQFVIPEELAATLDAIVKNPEESWLLAQQRAVLNGWKQYVLLNPATAIPYNLRNMTGDLHKMLVGNPSAFRYIKRSAGELFQIFKTPRAPEGDLRKFMELGGPQGTLQAQEMGQVPANPAFEHLQGERGRRGVAEWTSDQWQGYWSTVRKWTDYRELIARYAAFLDYKRQMMENNGEPYNFGNSIREEVMEIENVEDRAYKLANELIGAYNQTTALGRDVAAYLAPFWRWNEINVGTTIRSLRNAAEDGAAAAGVGRHLGAKGLYQAAYLGRWALLAISPWIALQLWNRLMHKDEWEDLDESRKWGWTLIIGRAPDGTVRYLDRLGYVGDFLEWGGLSEAPEEIVALMNNQRTWQETLTDMGTAPINKMIQAVGPHIKGMPEFVTGEQFFPDVFKEGSFQMDPRQIRDRGEYLARIFNLGPEYNQAMGKPQRYGNRIMDLVSRGMDPGANAFHEIRAAKSRFLERQGKKPFTGGDGDERSDALYNYKQSILMGDADKATKWWGRYYQLSEKRGVNPYKGAIQSIKAWSPTYGLKGEKEYKQFVDSLSPSLKQKLQTAEEYYKVLADTPLPQ